MMQPPDPLRDAIDEARAAVEKAFALAVEERQETPSGERAAVRYIANKLERGVFFVRLAHDELRNATV